MGLTLTTSLTMPFAEAVERTRNTLIDKGFGILTEIDLKATLKSKLDEDIENYVILGACNPPLALRGLALNQHVGLLLPCNVVVRSDPDQPEITIVEAIDPQVLVDTTGDARLQPMAHEVGDMLSAALAALSV